MSKKKRSRHPAFVFQFCQQKTADAVRQNWEPFSGGGSALNFLHCRDIVCWDCPSRNNFPENRWISADSNPAYRSDLNDRDLSLYDTTGMKTWNFLRFGILFEDNIPIQMSRRQLANLSGQSLSNFTAHFCKGTGLPPKQDISMRRLHCAKQLLVISGWAGQTNFWKRRLFMSGSVLQSIQKICAGCAGSSPWKWPIPENLIQQIIFHGSARMQIFPPGERSRLRKVPHCRAELPAFRKAEAQNGMNPNRRRSDRRPDNIRCDPEQSQEFLEHFFIF